MTAATTWRWGCLRCLVTGAADGEANALALLGLHEMSACPATAPGRDELALRLARRAVLERLYPAEVPAYERGWRGASSNPGAGGAG